MRAGNFEAACTLLRDGAHATHVCADGDTVLHQAAATAASGTAVELVNLLLSHGALVRGLQSRCAGDC